MKLLSSELVEEVAALLKGPVIKNMVSDPHVIATHVSHMIEQREGISLRHLYYAAALMRPEHLGLSSWWFEVKNGWNRVLDFIVRYRFYHVFCGLLVAQDHPFLSAVRWHIDGKTYPIEDAELHYWSNDCKLPYSVPMRHTYMVSSEKTVNLDLNFGICSLEGEPVRIHPVGVTIAPRAKLIDVTTPINNAVPRAHVKHKISSKEQVKLTEVDARVKAFIENMDEK